jgi:hypothetical protein
MFRAPALPIPGAEKRIQGSRPMGTLHRVPNGQSAHFPRCPERKGFAINSPSRTQPPRIEPSKPPSAGQGFGFSAMKTAPSRRRRQQKDPEGIDPCAYISSSVGESSINYRLLQETTPPPIGRIRRLGVTASVTLSVAAHRICWHSGGCKRRSWPVSKCRSLTYTVQ